MPYVYFLSLLLLTYKNPPRRSVFFFFCIYINILRAVDKQSHSHQTVAYCICFLLQPLWTWSKRGEIRHATDLHICLPTKQSILTPPTVRATPRALVMNTNNNSFDQMDTKLMRHKVPTTNLIHSNNLILHSNKLIHTHRDVKN